MAGLPTTGRIASTVPPKLPTYAARRAPDGRIAGVGLPAGARLIASGSGVGTGQVPVSDPYGQLPASTSDYRPYEPSTPSIDGDGGSNPNQTFVAPGGGLGSALRYDEMSGYEGDDPSHPVNFATGAGMGVEPTDITGVYRDGNAFSNVPGAPSVAPVRAPLPLAQRPLKAPTLKPVARSQLAGAAINKSLEPNPLAGAAIQTQYEPAAQQLGGAISNDIADDWGAAPGTPTARQPHTFTPSKWAGTHAVEDIYSSPISQYGINGISDLWTARGLPPTRKVPGLFDPAEWWITRQLGNFGRGLAGG